MRRAVLTAAFAALLAPAIAGATSLGEKFDRANRAFWEQRYPEAAAAYEELRGLGVRDADLEFNLGTAYANAGRFGHSIAAFEHALALRPGDDDVEHNLALARRTLASRQAAHRGEAEMEARPGPWGLVLRAVTRDQAAVFFAVPWALAFLLLVVRRSLGGETARFSVGLAAAIVGGLAALAGTVYLGKVLDQRAHPGAIVVVDEAHAHTGPDAQFNVTFGASEGERLDVLGSESDYVRVRTRDGREGWVGSSELERL